MWIDYIEMFCGIGGFRLGLQKANQVVRTRIGKGQFSTDIKERKSWEQSDNSRGFLQEEENESLRRSCTKSTEGQTRIEGSGSKIGINPEQRLGNKKRRGKSLHKGSNGRVKQEFCCVWANDNDKYACQIYRKRFGDKELVEADIKTINVDTIPDHTLLTAGFPCQAFSVAGKRKGFQDTRGTLFYEICRVAEAKRSPLLLLENVKGLLSHDKGLTFQIILESLEELGYLVEWQVLNSKHFGVPQNRERVFIIGHLRGKGGQKIFPIGKTNENSATRSTKLPRQNSKSIRVGSHLNARGTYVIQKDNVLIYNHPRNKDRKFLYDPQETVSNLRTIQRLPSKILKDSKKTPLLSPNTRIRRLTPVECERLQGFPDGWTEGVSDTQRYKLLGNAVTTNVIEFLGLKILGSFMDG